MKKVIPFLAILVLCSCRVQMPQLSTHSVVHDSILITQTLRDTLVRIEADSAMISALIECDSLGQAHLRELISYRAGKRLDLPKIQIKNNVLTAIAYQQELEQKIEVLEKMLSIKSNQVQTITETRYTNKPTRWQQIRLTIANMVLVLVALSIGIQLYKLIRRR